MIQNKDIVVVEGDKDSSVVIIKKKIRLCNVITWLSETCLTSLVALF